MAAPADPQTCAACGSLEFLPLFDATDRLCGLAPGSFQIVECTRCGILRLRPRPAPGELRGWARPPAWPKGSTLADALERGWRRLLLADEAGFVERAFRHAAVDGPVLDLSPDGELLRRSLSRRGLDVLAGEANAPAGTCAVVTLFEAVERLVDPAAALESARALLHPQGRLVVAAPNAACWQFLTFGRNWSGLDVPRRLVHFRTHDLELLLDCCGFEVVRRKHFSWGRNPVDFAASLAPGLHPGLRRARRIEEGGATKLAKHLLFLALAGFAVPFTLIESACRAGFTILLEARKKW